LAPRCSSRRGINCQSRASAPDRTFGESPEENEQKSDESDEDFGVRMATNSEDENINITADEDVVELAAQ
jgi:hypothetical protein